jgi:hypothetical protein
VAYRYFGAPWEVGASCGLLLATKVTLLALAIMCATPVLLRRASWRSSFEASPLPRHAFSVVFGLGITWAFMQVHCRRMRVGAKRRRKGNVGKDQRSRIGCETTTAIWAAIALCYTFVLHPHSLRELGQGSSPELIRCGLRWSGFGIWVP